MLPHFSHPVCGSSAAAVVGGIAAVEVFRIQIFLHRTECLAEALEVDDFPLPQELDGIPHIGVVTQPEDVVVRGACLLLRRKVFRQVGDGVALGLEIGGGERSTGGRLGIYPQGVVDEVGVEARFLDLLRCQSLC